MTLNDVAQKVVDELEWSSSIPNVKAMVLAAITGAVEAEREACANLAECIGKEQHRIYSERVCDDVGDDIAEAIRNRSKE